MHPPIKRQRDGNFALSVRGAAFLTVPGLEAMVRHHPVLYRDLADPVAFLRGKTSPELARFWPYVFGAGGDTDPAVTALYSGLMADSQGLVAKDTLQLVDLSGEKRLLDVGGGTGVRLMGRGMPMQTTAVILSGPKDLGLGSLGLVAPTVDDPVVEIGFGRARCRRFRAWVTRWFRAMKPAAKWWKRHLKQASRLATMSLFIWGKLFCPR